MSWCRDENSEERWTVQLSDGHSAALMSVESSLLFLILFTHTERTPLYKRQHRLLTSSERYPPSILCGFSPPVGSHQQPTRDSQWNDPHDDEKQGGDPLRGQPRGDAGPVSSVDCLTLAHQAHSERSWGRCKKWGRVSGFAFGGDIPYQHPFSLNSYFSLWESSKHLIPLSPFFSIPLECISNSNAWLKHYLKNYIKSELKPHKAVKRQLTESVIH